MFLEIENLNKKVVTANIYRPPRELNEMITKFTTELQSVLHHRLLRSKLVILGGDFNIDLLKLNERHVYTDYFDMLTTNSLLPNITYPTRIDPQRDSYTLIDNIFSRSLDESVVSGILINRNFSDHQLVFSTFEDITHSTHIKINTPIQIKK